MIQNGPKTDANVCVDSAIQADNQICRARSARYFLEQSLVLAHTEFRYVILLLTSPVTQEAGHVGARPFFLFALGRPRCALGPKTCFLAAYLAKTTLE